MTPAERALLLAVAKRLTTPLNKFKGQTYIDLVETIIAVEAEATPEAPSKSCTNCGNDDIFDCAGCSGFSEWQPKPTEAELCPTCEGGMIYLKRTACPDCGGTGKKEKK